MLYKRYFSLSTLADKAPGLSMDWAKGVGGAKYSFTIEMRQRANCFVLPEEELPLATEETWAGIMAAAFEISHVEKKLGTWK